MSIDLLEIINPIKVYVTLTLGYAYFTLDRKDTLHRYLLGILLLCFVTELCFSLLYYYDLSTRISYSVSITIHHTLWLTLLGMTMEDRRVVVLWRSFFWLFAVLNFMYIEWFNSFNYFTVVVGAFIYLLVFIMESYKQLKKENVSYFVSNQYILLFAPVLFFFGLSLMFGFSTTVIASKNVIGTLSLYGLLINVACIAYYTLLNIYIYREHKRLQHG